MRSATVIPAQPAAQRLGAMGARGVSQAVGPAPRQDLDEASRLAIGAGRVGTGAQVVQPVDRTALPPGVGAFRRAVVRRYGRCRDALGAEPGQRAVQERQGVGLAVTEPHLGVGQPRVIVYGHRHVLPSRLVDCAGCRRGECACRRARSDPASWCPGAATRPAGRARRVGPAYAADTFEFDSRVTTLLQLVKATWPSADLTGAHGSPTPTLSDSPPY